MNRQQNVPAGIGHISPDGRRDESIGNIHRQSEEESNKRLLVVLRQRLFLLKK